MSEQKPQQNQDPQDLKSTKPNVLARAVVAAAAGAAVLLASGCAVEGPPVKAPTSTSAEAAPSDEQLVQTAARLDAAATLQLTGELLKASNATAQYDGNQLANFGTEGPAEGQTIVMATRAPAEHTVTLDVSRPAEKSGFSMQLYVDSGAKIMNPTEPFTADNLAEALPKQDGSSGPANIEVITTSVGYGEGSQSAVTEVGGHLRGPDSVAPLTLEQAQMTGAQVGEILTHTADEFGASLSPDALDELSQ